MHCLLRFEFRLWYSETCRQPCPVALVVPLKLMRPEHLFEVWNVFCFHFHEIIMMLHLSNNWKIHFKHTMTYLMSKLHLCISLVDLEFPSKMNRVMTINVQFALSFFIKSQILVQHSNAFYVTRIGRIPWSHTNLYFIRLISFSAITSI